MHWKDVFSEGNMGVLTIVLVVIGLFYTYAPHEIHNMILGGLGYSHDAHVGFGVGVLFAVVVSWLFVQVSKQFE